MDLLHKKTHHQMDLDDYREGKAGFDKLRPRCLTLANCTTLQT
jgi:hypothetical protein